ncbi:carbon-nitrogen hydrolase [Podospora conica]|nr:carbon-nitrogen hydrolase [Schizothecium conicum]
MPPPPPPPLLRLATASPSPASTTPLTLPRLSALAHRAAALHADILLLPEAFLGGYPRGASFGCTIGGRTPAGRDEYLAYFRAAVDLGDVVGDSGAGGGEAWVRAGAGGDGTREELERVARETGVFLVVGVVERAGGGLYCGVVFVCPEGGVRGKRRKVMPTGTERLVWAQGGAATLKAVSTVIRGVRVNMGAAICWESYMPLVRQALYAQNVNLYLAPTADGRDTWLSLLRTVGIEGRCFVVSSNMCVREGAAEEEDGEVAVDGDGDSLPHGGKSGQRRRSCVTSEGFEIALPAGSRSESATRPALSMTTAGVASRRLSVLLDDDGNEIVLPASASPLSSTRPTLSTAASRRMSVFDDDGNEIVLPRSCSPGAAVAPPPPRSTTTTTGMAPTPAGSTVLSPTVDGKTKDKEGGFISRGGSAIVGPFGDVLAGPQWEDDEGIIWADVDFDDCVRGRLDLDVAGSYSRNDSFKFSVQGLDLTPLPY